MKAILKNRLLWSRLFQGACVVILVLMVMPSPETQAPSNFDKVVHLGVFTGLGVLFYLGFPDRRRKLAPYLGLLAYGAGLEFLQAAIPYRSFDLYDLLVNFVGLALSLLLPVD